MSFYKRMRIAAVIGLLSSLVFALSYNVSYIPPAIYTDGSILLEQELDFYTMYCDSAKYVSFPSIIGQRTALVDFGALAPGSHSCGLTVTSLPGVDVNGVVIPGQESAMSNLLVLIVGPRVPGAPIIVQLTLI